MDWINIHVSTLRAPEYIGSEPSARAAWFNALVYCCEQENGGRIIGGALWKDRQWQQTCGITLKEVRKSEPLLVVDGCDVIVWRYPLEKEAEVKAKRTAGAAGGRAKAENRQRQTPSTATSCATSNPPSCAPTEREGKEKGREVEGNSSTLPPDSAGDPTAEEFLTECRAAGIPDDFAKDKFLAKQENGGFGRKWKPYVQRVLGWYREKLQRERGSRLPPAPKREDRLTNPTDDLVKQTLEKAR
jgi:hypothetical protein